MKVIVMNATNMPQEGKYELRKITPEEFKEKLTAASEIVSYVGYVAVQNVIEEITGVRVEKNRKTTMLDQNATILVAKLSTRYPSSYKKVVDDPNAYAFFQIIYTS
jgi:hypothetical protein